MSENEPPAFGDVDLSDAVFRETFMPRVRMIGVVLVDAVIDGLVENLTVNGVEVTAYVQSELDRRFPVRRLPMGTIRPHSSCRYGLHRAARAALPGDASG